MLDTQLCRLLGIQYPVLLGGMVYVSYAPLAAAVSNAGGLGVIAGGSFLSKDELAMEIAKARTMTDRPFGVNIPIMYPLAADMVDTAIEEGLRVVITSAGSPAKFTQRLHGAGIKVGHVVPSVKHARKAFDAGVDFLIAEGIEAGGHDSPLEITTMVLIPQVVDAVGVPVVAAGGIADQRGFVAARALGAQGIQMGTRFVSSTEAPVHPAFKQAIIDAEDDSTVLTGRTIGQPVRVIKNGLADHILDLEKKGMGKTELLSFIGPGRSRAASIEGDMANGTVMSGEVAGLIKEILSVSDIMSGIVDGSHELLTDLCTGPQS
ncbi:MAG: nitronate monooxygenase [Deltaproteobacteria bacterium]|nr:nitronate monooxygenase [Deltaproteobacteria bacterium]MCL5276958.1 nitronate monooxygenase [Deltaproteobacteria bacterium]